ncbi:MAG: hypothetical protein ABIH88_02375 [Patescibacteria group bacterium]|nr:hypothetical protein [Patescibacteria group bacterium]
MKQSNIALPKFVCKYFWGDDLKDLSWNKHKKYIIQTILEKGDSDAVSWLLSITDKKDLKSILPSLKLSPKSSNFWSLCLS